ncbi:MAG: type II secretion system GspH family protein [Synergistales bacterium]|nr:type II secretion system GspH family protein [Synergistales bacterium]
MRRSGFTLIEIMVVIALVGVVAAVGFAPLVHVVSQLRRVETEFGGRQAQRLAAQQIGRDLRRATPPHLDTALIVRHRDKLGGDADDMIAGLSVRRTEQGKIAGTVVYAVVREHLVRRIVPGLYRWFFPGDNPAQVDLEALDPEEGELVLPDVTGLRVRVRTGEEWSDEYRGAYPVGVRIALQREGARTSYAVVFPDI